MKRSDANTRNAAIVAARRDSTETNTALARRFGVSSSLITTVLRKAGIVAPSQYKYAERDAEIVRKWKAGQTLQQIGDHFGITRERARQIIEKRSGLRGEDGGAAVRSALKRRMAASKRHEQYIAKFGLTLEQCRLVPPALRRAFTMQRRSAGFRGIAWRLNLREWLKVWEASGVVHLRGRGRDSYCMARIDDEGPYSPDNVKIITIAENCREYQAAKHEGTRKNTKTVSTGVYYSLPGYNRPFQAFAHGKCVGYFKTAAEAIAAREAHQ